MTLNYLLLQGYLDVHFFDGFFFTQNVTVDKVVVADNKTKDIRFCANSTGFDLSVNASVDSFCLIFHHHRLMAIGHWRWKATSPSSLR